MDNELSEFKDLYVQTSKEYLQELNNALLKLEQNLEDKTAIEEIFRSAHSLKSQSAAMGYDSTGFLCHTIEDVFFEIQEGRMQVTPELADSLFKSFDNLAASIEKIEKEGAEVNLTSEAESLKSQTGVQTLGAGKSQHNNTITTASLNQVQSENQETTQDKEIPPSNKDSIQPDKQEAKLSNTVQHELTSIPVKVSILNDLMDLTQELLISQLKIKHYATSHDDIDLKNHFLATQKILENLQYKIMKARAVSVKLVFDHFPRAVRDLARIENKQIKLNILGEDLELDRAIVDKLDEPMIHIIRNAVSHGIEESGTITISATSEKDYAAISIKDDGKGINWQKLAEKSGRDYSSLSPVELKSLLFSGISTAEAVSEISGRGVGMTVVKHMVEDLGGNIDIESEPNKGTNITLKLPLTLAIVKAIMIKIGNIQYAIPSLQINRLVIVNPSDIIHTADQQAFILDKLEVPLLNIRNKLNPTAPLEKEQETQKKLTVVVLWISNEMVGLIIDEVIQSENIVIKELPKSLKNLKLFSGTTILSDGQAALVINPQGLI